MQTQRSAVGVEDLVSPAVLQSLADSLSRLAGVPVFFARPEGRLLTRTESPTSVCGRITTAEDVQRPCLQCHRMTFGLDGSHWPEGDDVGAQHPCPLPVHDLLLPVRKDGRVLALIGTAQVVADEAGRRRTRDLLVEAGLPDREITPFLDGIRTRGGEALEDIRASIHAIAQLVIELGGEALQARQTADRLDALARTDALTGLENRRQADAELASAWGLASRHGRPFGVQMLDIDHFKRVNDTCGHAVGDEVLVRLAALLARSLRSSDRVFRVGGEEFLIVCHESSGAAVSKAAERVRAAVRQTPFPVRDLPPVTVSVGVAAWPDCTVSDAAELVRRADEALYAAKRAGRDRVAVCAGGPPSAV